MSDAALRRSKRVALLAWLVTARPRGFHRREKIVAIFWPELPANRARAALRTSLTRLRHDHGAELIRGRGADEVAADGTIVTCDVVEFEDAIDRGDHERALALYRGPFLDGVRVDGAGEELEEWIGAERRRLHAAAVKAACSASLGAEAAGDIDRALATARMARVLAPHDETVARRVMELLSATGNRGSALREYEDFAAGLRVAFGVEPAAETQALRARLVSGTPPHDRAAVVREAAHGDSTIYSTASTTALGALPAALTSPTPQTSPPRRRRRVLPVLLAAAGIVGVGVTAAVVAAPDVAVHMPAEAVVEWQGIMPLRTGPPGRFGSRAVLDSTGDALLVFGGIDDVASERIASLAPGYWRLRGFGTSDRASWSRVATAPGPHPAPRWLFGASSVAALDRVIVHGGAMGFSSPCASDTWVLDHASGIGAVPRWREVRTRGATPPPRSAFDQVFDARRNRLIVFAGNDCFYPDFEDTWVLAFDDSSMTTGAWTMLDADSSAGIPLQRDAYMAAYDTAAGRLLIFGGRAAATPTGELWALEHANGMDGTAAWHPIRCEGEAPVLLGAASAYDARADTWTLFGGADANGQHTRGVWRVTGASRDRARCRWSRLDIAEPTPAARSGASAAFLSSDRGIVIFGGEFHNVPLADAWVLRGKRGP